MLHSLTNVLSMQQCRKNCQQSKHVGAEIKKCQYLTTSNRYTIATNTWPVRHYPPPQKKGVWSQIQIRVQTVKCCSYPATLFFCSHGAIKYIPVVIRSNDEVSPGLHVLIANLRRRRRK